MNLGHGMVTPVPQSKVHGGAPEDPGPGEHLWTMFAVYRVSPDSIDQLVRGQDPGPQLMDHESLLSMEGPGCYKCEQMFSVRLAHRKCRGSVSELQ